MDIKIHCSFSVWFGRRWPVTRKTRSSIYPIRSGLNSEGTEGFLLPKKIFQMSILNYYIQYMALTKCQFWNFLHQQVLRIHHQCCNEVGKCLTWKKNKNNWRIWKEKILKTKTSASTCQFNGSSSLAKLHCAFCGRRKKIFDEKDIKCMFEF